MRLLRVRLLQGQMVSYLSVVVIFDRVCFTKDPRLHWVFSLLTLTSLLVVLYREALGF